METSAPTFSDPSISFLWLKKDVCFLRMNFQESTQQFHIYFPRENQEVVWAWRNDSSYYDLFTYLTQIVEAQNIEIENTDRIQVVTNYVINKTVLFEKFPTELSHHLRILKHIKAAVTSLQAM